MSLTVPERWKGKVRSRSKPSSRNSSTHADTSVSSLREPLPTSQISPYKYEPLLASEATPAPIRLLRLFPGTYKSEIICSIMLASIPVPTENMNFEALSYVWGDSSRKKYVVLDGCRLSITSNLETALRHLRLPDRERVMWIDAICIDQQNLGERSEQVLHMKYLFENASRVLMWLGPADEDDRKALSTLSDMQRHVDLYGMGDCISCPLFVVTEKEWRILGSIFIGRPYWERRWIVQEVLLAKDALVVCGDATFPISFFAKLQAHIFRDPTRLPAQEYKELESQSEASVVFARAPTKLQMKQVYTSFIQRVQRRFFSFQLETKLEKLQETSVDEFLGIWSLLDAREKIQRRLAQGMGLGVLLGEFEHCKCEDDRDIIYAILGISNLYGKVSPDYSKPVSDVYTEATKAMALEAKSLDVLCGVTRRRPSKSSCDDKPSWVPDWSVAAIPSPMIDPRIPNIGSTPLPGSIFDPDNPRLLRLEGVILDKISKITKMTTPQTRIPSSARNLGELEDVIHLIERKSLKIYQYPTGEDVFNVFWRTLLRYQSRSNYHPLDSTTQGLDKLDRMDYGWKLFRRQNRFMSTESTERPTSWKVDDDFLNYLSGTLNSWDFCATESGYMGLVPKLAAPGDLVAIVDRCTVPFVLRISETGIGNIDLSYDNEIYELVGPCYLHGIAEGWVPSTTELKSVAGTLNAAFPRASPKRTIVFH